MRGRSQAEGAKGVAANMQGTRREHVGGGEGGKASDGEGAARREQAK